MKQCLFFIILLLCSCTERQIENELSKQTDPIATSNEIKSLIEKARWGDNVASNKLADCYREGRGVKKDFIGMIAMAGISEKQGGISMDAYFKSLPKDDEYRRIYEIVDLISRHHQEPADSIIGKMDKQNNPDLDVIKGIDAIEKGDTIGGKQIIQSAVNKGSSLGILIHCLLEYMDKPEQDMSYLLRLAEAHPFLYKMIGDSYRDKKTNRKENNKLAAHYYLKADEYAMLPKNGAIWLLSYHEDGGDVQLSDMDIKRIQKLAGVSK